MTNKTNKQMNSVQVQCEMKTKWNWYGRMFDRYECVFVREPTQSYHMDACMHAYVHRISKYLSNGLQRMNAYYNTESYVCMETM